MATIQVRDIPDRVYEVLARRARAAGKSLQSYMLEQIERLAGQPTDDELFDLAGERLASRGPMDVGTILADLTAGRR